MDDATIKLILDLGGSSASVAEVQAKLEGLKGTVQATAGTYEVLDTVVNKGVGDVGTYAIATDRVNVALDEEVRKAVAAAQAQRALGAALDDIEGPTTVATAALTKLGGQKSAGGMGALGAAYGLQDVIAVLSMGGGWSRALMSATNNITPMLVGLGLGGGLAGVAGLAVTAIAALGPALEGLGGYFDGSIKTKVPEATDKLDRLTDSIKKDKEAIEELRKARELDFFQLQDYIKKTADLANKERELADARKARSVGPGEDRKSRERGSAFREALQEYGGGEKLIGALERAGVDTKRAEQMVSDALSGAGHAINDIQGRLAGRGAREQIGYRSPEQRERARRQSEATDATLRANAEAAKEAEKKAEEQAREDRAADARTAQMQARIEQRGRREQAQAGAVRRREAMHGAAGQAGDFDMGAVAKAGVRNVEALQRQAAQSGTKLSATEAARMVLQQRKQLEEAQREAFGAIMGTMNGQAQQLQYLRSIAQEARRMNRQAQPTALPMGMPLN